MHSYFDTEMCEDGELYWYESILDPYGNFISGIPLFCVNGQYSPLCYDGTNDPDSARVLCTGFGYYGE